MKLTFRRPDGSHGVHDTDPGTSVMEAAVAHGEDGIVAECGGSLMCATCHVYVDPAFSDLLAPPAEDEAEMLTCTAAERRPTSRLSCQLVLTDDLDGLVVEIPEEQV